MSHSMTTKPWITVIGVGDDGLEALPKKMHQLIEKADLLVGGDRHQAMVPNHQGERLTWQGGLKAAMDEMEKWRGRNIVVLATGDPMCFGAGTNLQKRFKPEELMVHPVPGAFSLACARMKWSLPDTECFTLHGRPHESLNLYIAPNTRLVMLSWDGSTPQKVADILVSRGFGQSKMTVLEHMGGEKERRIDGLAGDWSQPDCAMLNTICVDCIPDEDGAEILSRAPGLPDDAYEHDGLITKREVRAVTLAALQPLPGQVLWDVGAGSGAIGIEWMRAARWAKAVAIEKNPDRLKAIEANAHKLGVPKLNIIAGTAPEIFEKISKKPDAIFLGGAVADDGLLERCLDILPKGGRLVANGVTAKSQSRLMAFAKEQGGDLVRLSVARAEPVAGDVAFQPFKDIVQLQVTKA